MPLATHKTAAALLLVAFGHGLSEVSCFVLLVGKQSLPRGRAAAAALTILDLSVSQRHSLCSRRNTSRAPKVPSQKKGVLLMGRGLLLLKLDSSPPPLVGIVGISAA